MIPKSGRRFPACAKPWRGTVVVRDASAGEGRSEKIMLQNKGTASVHMDKQECRLAGGFVNRRLELAHPQFADVAIRDDIDDPAGDRIFRPSAAECIAMGGEPG